MFFEQYSHEPNIAVARAWLHVFDIEMTEERRAALEARQKLGYDALGVMEEHLESNDYFVGGRYSIADIALYAYTHVADEGGFDLGGYPAILAWLERVSSQPRYIPITPGLIRKDWHDYRYAQRTSLPHARSDPGPARSVRPGRRTQQDTVDEFASRIASCKRVFLAGIGTSHHATLVGEHLMRAYGGGPDVRAVHSFDLALYGPELRPDDCLVAVSHRGAKRYTALALEKAREAGCPTALITGEGGGGEGRADAVFRTVAQEKSSAHTVSYTSAVAVLALLAGRLGLSSDRLSHFAGRALEGGNSRTRCGRPSVPRSRWRRWRASMRGGVGSGFSVGGRAG